VSLRCITIALLPPRSLLSIWILDMTRLANQAARSQTHNLLITSLAPWPLRYWAARTEITVRFKNELSLPPF